MNDLLFKYEIIKQKEQQNIKRHICTTTGRIAECIKWHQPFEGRIKKIDDGNDAVFYHE